MVQNSNCKRRFNFLAEEKIDRYWEKSMMFCSKYWGCHQMPSRSFFLGKYQMPLCARCTGIILGSILALILLIVVSQSTAVFSWQMCLAMLLPMVMDGSIQLTGKYESNNLKRVISGILFGFSFILIIGKIIF